MWLNRVRRCSLIVNRIAAYTYGLSAASFACIIQTAANAQFWNERPITGALLGATIPFCVGSAWLLEHRPIKVHSVFYKISCGASIALGIAALSLFLFGVSRTIGFGFLVGVGLAFWSVNGLTDNFPNRYSKENPERNQADE